MSHGVIHNAGGDKFAHLGHFRSPDVLKHGHNQGVPPRSTVMPAPPAGPRRPLVVAGEGAIEKLGKRKVRRALATGGAGAAAVAEHRPVAAAKFAAKQAGATAPQRREMVAAARLNPESRSMERKTARDNLATAVGDVRSTREALRTAVQGRRSARRTLRRGGF